jgi:3',5'-cyclic AMP phosphodiesterase CpdA
LRVVAHVSDLHFGRLDQSTLPALAQAITSTQPDALVVSGDVTQRARTREFAEARAFLNSIPCPKIVVPGNHDIPLFNIFARALRPLARFKRHFGNEPEPFYADDEIAIAGLNTARSLSFKGGRINAMQTERACSRFAALGRHLMRIVVTHHPFDIPDKRNFKDLVGRARMAIDAFARCHVDILLSGHMHIGGAEASTVRYRTPGHSMLLVQAGTATSSRLRGEANSCNIVRIDRPRVAIERLVWDDDRRDFTSARSDRFELKGSGWARAA